MSGDLLSWENLCERGRLPNKNRQAEEFQRIFSSKSLRLSGYLFPFPPTGFRFYLSESISDKQANLVHPLFVSCSPAELFDLMQKSQITPNRTGIPFNFSHLRPIDISVTINTVDEKTNLMLNSHPIATTSISFGYLACLLPRDDSSKCLPPSFYHPITAWRCIFKATDVKQQTATYSSTPSPIYLFQRWSPDEGEGPIQQFRFQRGAPILVPDKRYFIHFSRESINVDRNKKPDSSFTVLSIIPDDTEELSQKSSSSNQGVYLPKNWHPKRPTNHSNHLKASINAGILPHSQTLVPPPRIFTRDPKEQEVESFITPLPLQEEDDPHRAVFDQQNDALEALEEDSETKQLDPHLQRKLAKLKEQQRTECMNLIAELAKQLQTSSSLQPRQFPQFSVDQALLQFKQYTKPDYNDQYASDNDLVDPVTYDV